jgi:hypothetical protein
MHYPECPYPECRYAECRYSECHYAECRYAECRGALKASTAVPLSTNHPVSIEYSCLMGMVLSVP